MSKFSYFENDPTQRSWLWSALALKPYGNRLLSPGGHLWIGFVRLIVGALALVEGVSWAYVGSLAGGTSGWLSWLFALVLGCIIFVFVWGVDVSLMSLDLDSAATGKRQRQAKAPAASGGEGSDVPSDEMPVSLWQRFLDYWSWPLMPVGIRTALVLLSLVVTAPFISMYVFRAEISHELENRFQANLEKVKTQKLEELAVQKGKQQDDIGKAQEQVNEANTRYQEALKDYRQEVAGQSATGRYGDGPAARANLLVAERLKQELDKQLSNLERLAKAAPELPAAAQLQALEEAALRKDFATLRVRFGVQDVPDSFVARSKVVTEKFIGTEEFNRVELAVQSLLGFLAGALFLLKYFQPQSVRIYFNEERQDQWHEYALGTYDRLLKPDDKAARLQEGRPMAPQYFVRLWDQSIAPAISDQGLAEASAKVQAVESAHQTDLAAHAACRATIGELNEKIEQTHQEMNAKTKESQRLADELARIATSIANLAAMAAAPGGSAAAQQQANLIAQQAQNVSDKEANDQALGQLAVDLQRMQDDLSTAQAQEAKLALQLKAVWAVRQTLDEKSQALAHAAIDRVKV